MHLDQLEGVAAEILVSNGLSLPVDAFVLAMIFSLVLTPVGRYEESFDGHEVRFNAKAPHRVQQEYVAKCVARVALQQHGFYATEQDVSRLARALMMPRKQFLRDLERGGIEGARKAHVHVTTAMIGARAAELYAAEHQLSA